MIVLGPQVHAWICPIPYHILLPPRTSANGLSALTAFWLDAGPSASSERERATYGLSDLLHSGTGKALTYQNYKLNAGASTIGRALTHVAFQAEVEVAPFK